MKRQLRRLVARLLRWLELPGSEFLDGPYLYWRNSFVFARSSLHRLDVAPDVELHMALFNLQDSVTIEEGVVLGHQVAFLTGRHDVGDAGVQHAAASRGPIVVRRGAWIASRAILLGGVTVGEGAMVGAGAVVTKDVPPHEFWAGNPARLIRAIV